MGHLTKKRCAKQKCWQPATLATTSQPRFLWAHAAPVLRRQKVRSALTWWIQLWRHDWNSNSKIQLKPVFLQSMQKKLKSKTINCLPVCIYTFYVYVEYATAIHFHSFTNHIVNLNKNWTKIFGCSNNTRLGRHTTPVLLAAAPLPQPFSHFVTLKSERSDLHFFKKKTDVMAPFWVTKDPRVTGCYFFFLGDVTTPIVTSVFRARISEATGTNKLHEFHPPEISPKKQKSIPKPKNWTLREWLRSR